MAMMHGRDPEEDQTGPGLPLPSPSLRASQPCFLGSEVTGCAVGHLSLLQTFLRSLSHCFPCPDLGHVASSSRKGVWKGILIQTR